MIALKRLREDSTYELELTELDNKKKFDAEANKSVSLTGLWRDPFLRYCITLSVMMNVGSELVGYIAVRMMTPAFVQI